MWGKEWGAIEQVAVFSGTNSFAFPCLGLEKVGNEGDSCIKDFPGQFSWALSQSPKHPQGQRPKARTVRSLVSRGLKHLDIR